MSIFFKSAAIGMVVAIVFGLLAFVLAPLFDALGVYMTPAALLLPVIGSVIPSKMEDWLIPSGGPAAGVFLILIWTLLFWTVVFGAFYFAWAALRRRRAAQ